MELVNNGNFYIKNEDDSYTKVFGGKIETLDLTPSNEEIEKELNMCEEMNIFNKEELSSLYKMYTELYYKAWIQGAEYGIIKDLDKHRDACIRAIQELNKS